MNLSIALACMETLVNHGVTVKMSRTTDIEKTSAQDINEANAFAPDLAVDIHNNAGGGDGCEVFYHYGGGVGKTLANNILAEVVKIGQNSRGAKTKQNANGDDFYYYIREISAPSCIVECAFVDTKDIQIVDTAAEQRNFGIAVAKGILKTLGISFKEQPQTQKPETNTGKLYRVQVGAFAVKSNAENMMKKLKADGYDAFIVEVNK